MPRQRKGVMKMQSVNNDTVFPGSELLPADVEKLEERIGHHFSNRRLLLEALTHSSFSNEHRAERLPCNERLEFLGDSVLSVITSEHIFVRFPDNPEGELTRMRAELVCEKALAVYASEIDLGHYLLLGNGEERGGGRERKSIVADAFEALIAAVYLDAGDADGERDGRTAVRKYLLPLIDDMMSEILRQWHGADYKTLLQQLIQRSEGEILEYVTVEATGPDHNKTFRVEARLNSNIIGAGSAHSKRAAEQEAAHQALRLFGEL